LELSFSTDAFGKLSNLSVAAIFFSQANNKLPNSCVDEAVETAQKIVLQKFPAVESVAADETVKGVRSIFSQVGIDPTKERPSGEALIRRVVSGKGIYRVNPAVDLNNVVSLLCGCPCGVYDVQKVVGEKIFFRIGKAGESYEGLSKLHNAENKIVSVDASGIFGAPTADSKRTSVSEETTSLLMVIYCPKGARDTLDAAVAKSSELFEKCLGARQGWSGFL